MLNAVIRFALRQRLLVVAVAVFLFCYGGWQITQLPIDVFPDLDRPRVVVMTEAHGLAPEEVETLITFPLETALNGATGVQAVRSSSGVGLSVIYVEFDWGTSIQTDRQIVTERIATVADRLPQGITPQLAPISSIMGQMMVIGMWSEGGQTAPMELRTLADWVVQQRLRKIAGVSQVIVMGGERKQFQVLVDADQLARYGVSLHQVRTALAESNANATGGYLLGQGPEEILVRALGRLRSEDDIGDVVVTARDGLPVLVRHVARVIEGPEVKRGESAAFARTADGSFTGGPAVVLTITKQPRADTRQLTDDITAALADLQQSSALPDDVRIDPALYQQRTFIDRAINNIEAALRDGAILVAIVLFLFLLNFRTTFITLTAIPMSLVITAMVFKWFGLSINTMTLGGLAVAIGELVDDAIVDAENIFRRLRENRLRPDPLHPLLVVFRASVEVRNSIVFSTIIVVLVFLPVFALGGMEGRVFGPVGVAYIVSILASLVVSLTLTPVLSYWLLPQARFMARERESWLLRGLKRLADGVIRFALRAPLTTIAVACLAVAVAALAAAGLQRDFLPPFNEGSLQVNVILPPGSSLETSRAVARKVEARLQQVADVRAFVSKTGRAELDEHAVPVNATEFIAALEPHSNRSREELLDEVREALADIPGIVTGVEQPLAHLISHMLSGVQAQVAVKLYGDDLNVLRAKAREIETIMSRVPGVADLQREPQIEIPQLRIEIDGHQLQKYGLRRAQVNEFVETAMNGTVISEVLVGQRSFDLLLRLDEPHRGSLEKVRRLAIDLPDGSKTPLESVANVRPATGPNTIQREQVRKRIVVQCNVAGRGLVDVVEEIKARLEPIKNTLPSGYFIEYGGQFESQQSAAQVIAVLFAVSLVGMFLVLYTMFGSANLSLQVMAALPAAFIGSVAALYLTRQTLTVAAMIGFISLAGIATRNGILLINHYLHLVRYEGERWSREMIVRAGKERLAPVLMTALTGGIGLAPLAMAAGQSGKEILYPIATVIIGGLVSSTLLEFLVRPALFWRFGLNAAASTVTEAREEVELDEHEAAPTAAGEMSEAVETLQVYS